MKRYRWLFLVLVVGMQGMFCSTADSAEPARAAAAPAQEKGAKVAIVIGNSNYPSGALANPKNDATAMAASLKKLGFLVELKLDATKADMDAVFKRFSAKAETAGVAALFYAGHGVQVNGSNYLVPIDARPQTERDLKREMIKMDDVIDDMGGAKVKLVFFDACRDNPLSRSFSRGGSRGMAAPVEATGTLISFATKHGNTAADGDGRHSPYTTALLTALESASGVEIEQMLRKVQQGVRVATNGQQEPWRYGSLDGEFYFQAPAPQVDNTRLQQEAVDRAVQEAIKRANEQAASDATRRAGDQQGRERDTSSATVELAYWDSIKTSQNADDFKAYLRRYAKGSFVDLAQNRIAALEREAKRQGEESRKPAKPPPAFGGNDQTAVELAFWDSIKNSTNVDDLKEYLASYPQGRFAGLARNRLRALGAALPQASARPAPQAAPENPRAVAQAPTQIALIVPDQPVSVAASSAAAASSAFPQTGDIWTYRYVNGWKKDSPQTITVKVEESESGRVTDRMSLPGGSVADQRTYEGKVEAAERPLGRDVRVIELLPYAQRLLQDGLISGQEKVLPDLVLGAETYRIKAKLIGRDKISVAAGTFDAVRVQIVGENLAQVGLNSLVVKAFTHSLWFVPEIRRAVKFEHKSVSNRSFRLDDDSVELVSFVASGQASPQIAAKPALPLQSALDLVSGLPRAGDSWTYRYVNGWRKDSPQTITVRVEGSEGGRVTDKMSMQGGRGADERTHEGKPEVVERPMGSNVRVIELLPYVQRLLQEGLKPGQEKDFPDLVLGVGVFRIKAKLIGQDKISVPAGSFDALRVDIAGQNKGRDLRDHPDVATGRFSHSVWFVPEIRRVVRVEHKTTSHTGRPLDSDTLELVSFTLR